MKNDWLKSAIFYEIYPTSFYDTNGDGIGDLKGITQKLDYIKNLGCNAIWINPCFCSPFRDGGYDISDYKKINPKFGTNQDAADLCKRARELGIKVLFDLVPGHTSDEHPWFKESAKANPSKYKDYYIWTEGALEMGTPEIRTINGMQERDGAYAINFFAFQPSLNYGFVDPTESWQIDYRDDRLKPLRDELVDIMNFWLDIGCDGFRIDMAWSLVKNDKDGSANAWLWAKILSKVREKHPDALFIPETGWPFATIAGGFDMDFCFQINEPYYTLVRHEKGTNNAAFAMKGKNYFSSQGEGSIECFAKEYPKWLEFVKDRGYIAMPSGNHDIPRLSYNRDELDQKIFFAFLLTIPTVPFIYYGDEIGMKYQKGLLTKDGGYLRTGSRTPMQWSEGKNKGFSCCDMDKLYLPVDLDGESVESQEKCETSLLNFIKNLIKFRKEENITAESSLEIITQDSQGYPAAFKVDDIVTVIQPASRQAEIKLEGNYQIIFHENADFVEDKVIFKNKGYIVMKKMTKN